MKKNYTISINVRTFWLIVVPLSILIIIIGGIGGIFIVDRLVLPKLPGISNRGILEVPNIVGLTKDKARQGLYAIGLRLQVQEREYNDTQPKDIVLRQRPESQEKVKKGRHVFVVLSKGPEVEKVPDVSKMKGRQGKRVLREAGFSKIIVFKAYSEVYDKEIIVRTNPKHGTVISREVPIEVTISKGSRPTHAVVPNVIGEILSEAKIQIKESGLLTGKINYKVNVNLKPGIIITQSISPGTNAPLESKINLVVSATK
jgi:serine/threonine-protein kinase